MQHAFRVALLVIAQYAVAVEARQKVRLSVLERVSVYFESSQTACGASAPDQEDRIFIPIAVHVSVNNLFFVDVEEIFIPVLKFAVA
jgi:hypothetical protein